MPADPLDASSNLDELVHRRADLHPDRVAFVFLSDGEHVGGTLSYGELVLRGEKLASRLAAEARPGDRALLAYPAGLDFVIAYFACLRAGLVPVPVVRSGWMPRRTMDRLGAIAHDCGARILLADASLLAVLAEEREVGRGLEEVRWLDTGSALEPAATQGAAVRRPGGEDPSGELALIQYTSGSTSDPKGVMVTHFNLMQQQRLLRKAWGHSEATVLVNWLPHFHDMGLIGHVLHGPSVGGTCVLMSPEAFLKKPLRWLKAFTRHRGTFSAAPNFAYELCARTATVEDVGALDLSSWKLAVVGAEPVRASTLRAFARRFRPAGFPSNALNPGYGLAEATLAVSVHPHGSQYRTLMVASRALQEGRVELQAPGSLRSQPLVSNGVPWLGHEIAIVDPASRVPCPADRVGEVWVRGDCVAAGYWGKPSESEETFRATLGETGQSGFLRTGDLGFTHDGLLYLTGRIKDVIIIRGVNHYPQDIELTVEKAHPLLRVGGAAAFQVMDADEERLIVVQEVMRSSGPTPLDEIGTAIRREVVQEHGIVPGEVVLVRPGAVPKTSSGKVRRAECRQRFLDGRLDSLKCIGPVGGPAGTSIDVK